MKTKLFTGIVSCVIIIEGCAVQNTKSEPTAVAANPISNPFWTGED